MRAVAIVLLTLILAGCAVSSGVSDVPKKLRPAPGEPVGWVVASVSVREGASRHETPFDDNQIYFRPAGTKGRLNSIIIGLNARDTSKEGTAGLEIVENGLFGTVQRVAVRAGQYNLVGGYFSTDTGNYAQRLRVQKLDIPFQVNAGETLYLGAFVARVFQGRNLLGMKMRAGALFEVHDQLERDMALLLRKEGSVQTFGNTHRAQLQFPTEPPLFFVPVTRQ